MLQSVVTLTHAQFGLFSLVILEILDFLIDNNLYQTTSSRGKECKAYRAAKKKGSLKIRMGYMRYGSVFAEYLSIS